MSRLSRYRELMQTLDPSGDPRAAFESGWCVDRWTHLAAMANVARRLELEPWSSHLLVGGIGSGKTTELWRIHEHLVTSADQIGAECEYIDMGEERPLSSIQSCDLVFAATKRILELEDERRSPESPPPRAVEEARSELRQIKSWYAPDDADRADAAARLTPHLAALKDELIDDRNLILLFDSLDRMPPHRFENAVASDVQALQDAKIGCVIVGPMRAQYRATESIARLFDHNIHTLSDIAPDSTGLFVLAEVLRRRAPADILGDDITRRLALGSGGVMRDLIALAKSAAQEAYVDGNDFITPVHVDRAVEQLGRVRAVGLDGEQVQALRLVRDKGTLVIRGERELTLLETRRVLDYGGGKFVVHPALLPLLDVMTAAA